jgi:DNA-binding NarL/FixJ family response regulator
MMGQLKRQFRELNIAAVSIYDYPADLGMKFISNGINSYVNYFDGKTEFFKGLDSLRNGKKFIASSVQERIDEKGELPPPELDIGDRAAEVLRLLCNGFTTEEIADELYISMRTVKYHKTELYSCFGTRNENELIRVALYLGLIKIDELDFYGRNFELRLNRARGRKLEAVW